MYHYTVLLNPNARRGRTTRLLPHLRAFLKDREEVRVLSFRTVPEALDRIRQVPVGSRLVVAGGDGTLHQMLPAMIERSLEVGIIAYGSGNDTAKAIGLEKVHWKKAVEMGLNNPTAPYDIGWAEATLESGDKRPIPFISSFSVGFDANVGYRASFAPRLLVGTPRYFFAGVQEWLGMRHWDMTVECNGHLVYQGPTLMATSLNTSTYGGGMPIMPKANVHDGLLNLILVKNIDREGTITGLLGLAAGRRVKHPEMVVHDYKTMRIRSKEPFPLGADGEFLCMAVELTIEIKPGLLNLVQNR